MVRGSFFTIFILAVFRDILESACFSVFLSVCLSVCLSMFISTIHIQTLVILCCKLLLAVIVMTLCRYIDHLFK